MKRVYQCERCPGVYESEAEAIACEASHLSPKEMEPRLYCKGTAEPIRLAVFFGGMEDGEERQRVIMYERLEELPDETEAYRETLREEQRAEEERRRKHIETVVRNAVERIRAGEEATEYYWYDDEVKAIRAALSSAGIRYDERREAAKIFWSRAPEEG